jgi:hypothetical protein
VFPFRGSSANWVPLSVRMVSWWLTPSSMCWRNVTARLLPQLDFHNALNHFGTTIFIDKELLHATL